MPDAARIGRRPCIFVSAVSRELETAREIVGHSLRVYHNVDVIFQQEFGTESGDLLDMLRRHVDECDGVLQLIGDAYGAAPRVPPADFDHEVSFTQFEFLYALRQPAKTTWLIRVDGSCTRNVRAPEYVVSEDRPGHSLRPEVEEAYRARLERLRPGQPLVASAKDDPELMLAIHEHNRRRTLQRDYAAGLHTHLQHPVKDDDELVQTIRKLTGLPSSLPRTKGKIAGLRASIQQWDSLPANVSMGAFKGRAPLTFRVLSVLNPFGNQPAPSRRIVLHGLGGSGKTTLATEIGHLHNVLGHHVLMTKPVPGHDLDQDLAGLAKPLKLSSGAAEVSDWLRDHDDWLMIVDGIDDRDSAERVHAFCEDFQSGHFLITSCFEGYWKSVRHAQQFICYEVDVLNPDAAHRLLHGLLEGAHRSDPDAEVRELSTLLGGLPLAIQHAQGYLAQNIRRSIKNYIQDLEAAPILPDAGTDDFAEAPRPVAATWQASLQRMRPASRTLLRLLSFLTDHPIPLHFLQSPEVERVFAQACTTDPFEHAPTEMSRPQLAAAIRELGAYSLLRWYDEKAHTQTVHRLVLRMTQASLRAASPQMLQHGLHFQHALASQERTVDGAHKKFMAHAIRFVTDYLATEGGSARALIYPHIFQLAALYREQEMTMPAPASPLPLAADELVFLGETSCLSGNDEDAVHHFARAAAMSQLTPYERARANQNLAYSLFGLDRIQSALEHYSIAEEALTDQPEDRRHNEIRYDLHSGRGWLLRFLGRLPEAIRDFERARSLTRQDDDARIADIALGLGATYDYAGDYDAAERHCREAAARADAARDPHVQACVQYMMGWLLIRQGSLQEGMDCCVEAVSLGEKYDFTNVQEEASWIMAVGFALQGDSKAALETADRALQWSSEYLAGWKHFIRGIMRYRVGDQMGAKADFERAVALSETSIARFENFDNVDTLAFSHAGLAIIGQSVHVDLAVRAYCRARQLAAGGGIVDIGRTALSCFGDDPAVTKMADALLAAVS